MSEYVKELAMHISKFPINWIKSSFIHVLTAALEDLSLQIYDLIHKLFYNHSINRCIILH